MFVTNQTPVLEITTVVELLIYLLEKHILMGLQQRIGLRNIIDLVKFSITFFFRYLIVWVSTPCKIDKKPKIYNYTSNQ